MCLVVKLADPPAALCYSGPLLLHFLPAMRVVVVKGLALCDYPGNH